MSECQELIKALTIFDKYDGCISAEHDVITVSIDKPLSLEEYSELKVLNWIPDGDDEGIETRYWMAFV